MGPFSARAIVPIRDRPAEPRGADPDMPAMRIPVVRTCQTTMSKPTKGTPELEALRLIQKREYRRNWYLRNRTEQLANQKARYLANRPNELIHRKEWYAKNKDSQSLKDKIRRKEHSERIRASDRERYKKRKDQRVAYSREWYAKNRTSVLIRVIQWQKDNKDLVAARGNRRRARKKNAMSSDCRVRVSELKNETNCYYCKASLSDSNRHIDHVIPLSRGGADSPENLVAACASCNCSKQDRTPEEWQRTLNT